MGLRTMALAAAAAAIAVNQIHKHHGRSNGSEGAGAFTRRREDGTQSSSSRSSWDQSARRSYSFTQGLRDLRNAASSFVRQGLHDLGQESTQQIGRQSQWRERFDDRDAAFGRDDHNGHSDNLRQAPDARRRDDRHQVHFADQGDASYQSHHIGRRDDSGRGSIFKQRNDSGRLANSAVPTASDQRYWRHEVYHEQTHLTGPLYETQRFESPPVRHASPGDARHAAATRDDQYSSKLLVPVRDGSIPIEVVREPRETPV